MFSLERRIFQCWRSRSDQPVLQTIQRQIVRARRTFGGFCDILARGKYLPLHLWTKLHFAKGFAQKVGVNDPLAALGGVSLLQGGDYLLSKASTKKPTVAGTLAAFGGFKQPVTYARLKRFLLAN